MHQMKNQNQIYTARQIDINIDILWNAGFYASEKCFCCACKALKYWNYLQ